MLGDIALLIKQFCDRITALEQAYVALQQENAGLHEELKALQKDQPGDNDEPEKGAET